MAKRRDLLLLGLASPWLHGCGGGGDDGPDDPPSDRVIATSVPADDWPTASAESQAVPTAALQRLLGSAESHDWMRSILVVRNGLLIGEQYYGGARSSDLLHVRSVTKTVSSLLIGQALRDGRIADVDRPVRDLLPPVLNAAGTAAGEIPLRRILQMRGGLDFNESARMQEVMNAPDLARLALSLPSTGTTRWNYDSVSSHLLSPILARAYGADTLAVATRLLFEPLGIRQAAWSRDASGVHHGSFGLQLRTRDLLKLAWMAVDGGQWRGRPVVPADWLRDSHASHQPPLDFTVLKAAGYGYLWWTGRLGGHAVALAWGFGGQFAIVVPALRMAIATAARWNVDYATGDAHEQAVQQLVADFLAEIR